MENPFLAPMMSPTSPPWVQVYEDQGSPSYNPDILTSPSPSSSDEAAEEEEEVVELFDLVSFHVSFSVVLSLRVFATSLYQTL